MVPNKSTLSISPQPVRKSSLTRTNEFPLTITENLSESKKSVLGQNLTVMNPLSMPRKNSPEVKLKESAVEIRIGALENKIVTTQEDTVIKKKQYDNNLQIKLSKRPGEDQINANHLKQFRNPLKKTSDLEN